MQGYVRVIFYLMVIFHQKILVFASCRDLTLDLCDYGEAVPFETSNGLTQQLCQQFCSKIYEDKCQFFIYDTKEEICELFDYHASNYVNKCQIVGATPTPSLRSCNDNEDLCIVSKTPKMF